MIVVVVEEEVALLSSCSFLRLPLAAVMVVLSLSAMVVEWIARPEHFNGGVVVDDDVVSKKWTRAERCAVQKSDACLGLSFSRRRRLPKSNLSSVQ